MVVERITRFENWKVGKASGPLGLYLTLTERCNLSCIFCRYRHRDTYAHEDSMSDEEWIKVIREAAEVGAKWVDLFGGEPLLRKKLFLKLIKVTKEFGMEGSMVTNGMLLSQEIAQKIVDARWNLVQISIDSPEEKVHNTLRMNKMSFALASEAIAHLVREKERVNSILPSIQINMVITSSNMQQLAQMVEFAHERGCQGVKFIPMVLSEKEAEPLLIQPESFPLLFAAIEKARETAASLGLETNLSSLKDSFSTSGASDKSWDQVKQELLNEHDGYPLCFSPWWALRVFPEGWATCCVSSDRKEVNLRGRDLKEVWKSSEFEKIRKEILHNTLPECERCCYVVAADNLETIEAIKEKALSIKQ